MKTPLIKTVLDKEWDKEVILYFLDEKDNQYDFGYDRIITLHPEMGPLRGKSETEKSAAIITYVEKYYHDNLRAIEDASRIMQKLWDDISGKYFIELQKLFGPLDFYQPQEIQAVASITKVGVIGGDNASFQIWYQTTKEPSEVKRHFAHEILHFYYYAYLKKKHFDVLIKNWDLAEIFAVIILNLPQFASLINKEDTGYQQHEKYFSHYKTLWAKCSNLDEYLAKTKDEGLISI